MPVFLIIDSPLSSDALAEAFVGPIERIEETPRFQDDLRRLSRGDSRVRKLWEKRKELLAADSLAAGTHLELIDSARRRYSARIDQSRRVGLERPEGNGAWVAVPRTSTTSCTSGFSGCAEAAGPVRTLRGQGRYSSLS